MLASFNSFNRGWGSISDILEIWSCESATFQWPSIIHTAIYHTRPSWHQKGSCPCQQLLFFVSHEVLIKQHICKGQRLEAASKLVDMNVLSAAVLRLWPLGFGQHHLWRLREHLAFCPRSDDKRKISDFGPQQLAILFYLLWTIRFIMSLICMQWCFVSDGW